MAPRDTENNAYAKFSGDKQRALWSVMVFSGVVNSPNLHKKKKSKVNDPCSCTKMTSPCISPCSSCALLNPLQKLLVNIFPVTITTRLLETGQSIEGGNEVLCNEARCIKRPPALVCCPQQVKTSLIIV